MTANYVGEIEGGKREPSALVVVALAEALGVTVDQLRQAVTCPACGYQFP